MEARISLDTKKVTGLGNTNYHRTTQATGKGAGYKGNIIDGVHGDESVGGGRLGIQKKKKAK